MLALTVKQPWAWATAAGIKPVENRAWRPSPKVIGQRIAIHAGKSFDWDVYLGDRLTDPRLKNQPCDPVRRPDGRCIVGGSKQLVTFAGGDRVVVLRRRLRVQR